MQMIGQIRSFAGPHLKLRYLRYTTLRLRAFPPVGVRRTRTRPARHEHQSGVFPRTWRSHGHKLSPIPQPDSLKRCAPMVRTVWFVCSRLRLLAYGSDGMAQRW